MEREVNIQINLQHDNIVKLYAAWADERNVYLVQEFADGGDLFRKVQVKGSRCQESVVQEVVACFLGVLQYLHGRVGATQHTQADIASANQLIELNLFSWHGSALHTASLRL